MRACFIVFITLFFTGCITTPGSIRVNSPTTEIPSIQEKYKDRFSRTERGMSLIAFQQLWPEALKSGETEEFSVYEFRDSTLYHTDADHSVAFWYTGKTKNHEYLQRAVFYFAEEVLIKYETNVQVLEING
jgi:hypothetical protein